MKKLKIILQSNAFITISIILILIYIFLNFNFKNNNINKNNFKGVIESYKIDGNKLTLQVKSKETIIANYYIKSEKEKKYLENNLQLGYSIKLVGTFENASNNTIPYNFNYKKYLKSKNINLIMNTKKYNIIKNNNIFYKIKNIIIKKILNKRNSEYYYTFILGDKSNLDSAIYDSYKINGITHLFAISGMHISMLIFILNKFKIKKIVILLLLYFYCFLVMFTPSVLRVTIFYTIKNSKLFEDISNPKLLIITAIILVINNPFIILDIGFIYSFTITMGLFLLKPKNILSLSVYAFILSLPINLYVNYEFNLLTVVANILIVPYVSFVLYPILLISIFVPILELIVNILIYLLENVNLIFNKFSIMIITGQLNIFLLSIYYLILFMFVKSKNKKILILLIIIIFINKYKYIIDTNYYIYYLDVNQGDCSVIIFPRHKEILMIDTGGKTNYNVENWQNRVKEYEQGESLISFLKGLGIYEINTLILTHGDYDHIGNANYLIENFKVNMVLFNNDSYNKLESELITSLKNKKIKYSKGLEELNINNNKLYILSANNYNNENDNSNVLYFDLNNYKFLFMGDAGVERERDILDKYNLTDIDFIKIGHHGSNTSSSKYFINQIQPKYSLISVGKNNRYGHPKQSVLDTIKDCNIYRTDQDGSIEIKLNKNGYKIKTYSP